jgi:hypothetical protein
VNNPLSIHWDSVLWDASEVAAIIGGAIALLTLVKSVFEYAKQGAQKRADQFVQMRLRFKNDQSFKKICDLLEDDRQELSSISFADKRDFLGFFEEIALMLNSGLINETVSHYMFGYYAVLCWESERFWNNVSRESPYWSLFRNFVHRMKKREKGFDRFDPKKFRF